MKYVLIAAVIVLMLSGGILNAEKEKSTSKFKISFSERFRFVGWDNAVNLDGDAGDGFAFTRHRTSLMGQWFPNQDMEFAVKLTNEFREYLAPKNRDFTIHEIIFDQLYLKWKNVGTLPLTLTVGRQNIILGEGFVVMDGHPLDGSRSIYFNALRADYRFGKKHRLTAFFMYQPVTDNILPVINSKDAPLIEKPEQGLGLYYSGSFNKTRLEAYLIRKDVDGTDDRPVESGINTLGARVIFPLVSQLSLTVEGAYQFGSYGDFDRAAMGGYFHLDYKVGENVPLLKKVTFGGIYLSGDDPATEKVEGWDP
ncbi:MAG: alginate export family protein, partial [bacterium]|nr:alginate export family protein [bacterium]